jgi:hypothetical protein
MGLLIADDGAVALQRTNGKYLVNHTESILDELTKEKSRRVAALIEALS